MYRISKTFQFEAAHRLDGLPQGHQCGRMHGHSYQVELFLEADAVNEVGFVRDYNDLKEFDEWLKKALDHQVINSIVAQPTAENIATFLYHRAAAMYHEVVAVQVRETGKTTATYAPHSLPPLDSVLDVFESLAAEPLTGSDRSRLVTSLKTLLGLRTMGSMGGAGGGGGGAAFGMGAQGGAGGAGGSIYFGGGTPGSGGAIGGPR